MPGAPTAPDALFSRAWRETADPGVAPSPNFCPKGQRVNLFPQGPAQISNATTMASSGVIATFGGGLPDNFSFLFPNAGTFSYQCRIHDDMNGTVTVT